MSETPLLKLPYIAAAQAQKHVTHNEAIRALDAVVQIAVLDRDLSAPPASPTDGDRYIVAANATGAWAGHDNAVAAWQDGAWVFYAPREGWLAWVSDEDSLVAWDGAAWVVAGGGAPVNINPAAAVGVNTTADATNKLAVKSDAVLHSHDDVTPGTGDARHVLNKSATARTASFVFQTGFSGRAEIGLTGDDDFRFKVSPDGSTFYDAIVIDNDDGSVTFPNSSIGGGGGGGGDVAVEDEGNQVLAAAGTLDFVGDGVTVTDGGSGTATVTIPGGGGAGQAPVVSSFTDVRTKVLGELEDVTILFLSDSTGTANNEWIYLFVVALGLEHPTHTVNYYTAAGAAGAWPVSPDIVQTGTGARAINVYNAAQAGYAWMSWFDGAVFPWAIAGVSPDLLVTNLGLNNRNFTPAVRIRQWVIEATQLFLQQHPDVPIAVVLQNPIQDDDTMTVCIEEMKAAASHYPGMTLVDVHSRFLEAGKPISWYASPSDTVHPLGDGATAYVNEMLRHWRTATERVPFGTFKPWWLDSMASIDLINNGDFRTWTTPATEMPDGWTVVGSNGTHAQSTTIVHPANPYGYSLRLNDRRKIRWDFSDLSLVRGKLVSVVALIYAEDAEHRMTVNYDGTGAIAQSGIFEGYNPDARHAADNWIWVAIDGLLVPRDATFFRVEFTGSSAANGTTYVDRVSVYEGAGRPTHARL